MLTLNDERGKTFGLLPNGDPKQDKMRANQNLFWGITNLDQCARNLKIEWDIQTGCKMGLGDALDVQWQMTSATSTQCFANPERCSYSRDQVSQSESGWWKSLYVCRGANPYTELDDTGHLDIPNGCGFGGICGASSEKLDDTETSQPMCPYSWLGPGDRGTANDASFATLAANDAQCACNPNRMPLSGMECHETTVFPDQCMCTGTGSACECKEQFHTTGEYVINDPFAAANIDCPAGNIASCKVTALLKFDVQLATPSANFEYFKIKSAEVSCESDFVLAPGIISDDGTMITCPVPRVLSGDGIEGVILQLSLNGLDWEEPIDFPHMDTPNVTSVEPAFGVSTGGTNVTVHGANFVNDPPIYCFWVDPTTHEETRVVAQFVTTTQLICVAPSLRDDEVLKMTPFTALKYAVYVSLNGRERGATQIDGSVQELAFNYFRLPQLEAIEPDSGFTSHNQTLMIYGNHICLYHNHDATACRSLTVTITYPPYCTTHSAVGAGCVEIVKRGTVLQTATNDVVVQIWDFENPTIIFSVTEQTYKVGLEFVVEGTSAILHTQHFTFYNSALPPDGCLPVGDYEPLTLKCLCLFRNVLNSGAYQITDSFQDWTEMTTVPSRRFDLCLASPYVTTATPIISPAQGGERIRIGARSFPDWTRWYDPTYKTQRFSCIFKFTVYRNGAWHEEYRISNTTMRSRGSTAGFTYATSNFVWAPIQQAAACPRQANVDPKHKTTCATPYADTAECCGFEDLEKTNHLFTTGSGAGMKVQYSDITNRPDSFRCFQCIVPSSEGQALLQHDLAGAGGKRSTVQVNLVVASQDYAKCPQHAVADSSSCDAQGNEFEYHAYNNTYIAPLYSSSTMFPGPPQMIKRYEQPTIMSIYPRALPLQINATLLITLDPASLNFLTLKDLVTKQSKCRLETCHVQQCIDLDDCRCSRTLPLPACGLDCGATCAEEKDCTIEYLSEYSVLVHLAMQATWPSILPESSQRALALSFNGQEWFKDVDQSIIFYHLPVAVNHKQSDTQVYSFGVVTDLNDKFEYFRLTDIAPGTPLISYMQEAHCDATNPSDIDCVWRIPRPASAQNTTSSTTTRRLSSDTPAASAASRDPGQPQLIYRFSPGKCTVDDANVYMTKGAGYKGAAGEEAFEAAETAGKHVPYLFAPPALPRELGCCEAAQVNLDITMTFSQTASAWFSQLLGTAPPGAPAGEYHVCFSVDGLFFVPMSYNHFTTHSSRASLSSYQPASQIHGSMCLCVYACRKLTCLKLSENMYFGIHLSLN